MSKESRERCQDCKFWRKEVPQQHWSNCDGVIVMRVLNEKTGKREFVKKIFDRKTSRYSLRCASFEKKDFRRKWK